MSGPVAPHGIVVRRALRGDAAAIAALHARRIEEGFLPTLGQRFLTRLYARVIRTPGAPVFVATRLDGSGDALVGFAAACAEVAALYRRFVLRDGLVAAVAAAPRLARSWRRAVETLRYPGHTGDLPRAEILAVAVEPAVAGRGVGRALVDACVRDLARTGVAAVRVVAARDNAAARALYLGSGFAEVAAVEVHAGAPSVVYVRGAAVANPAAIRRDPR